MIIMTGEVIKEIADLQLKRWDCKLLEHYEKRSRIAFYNEIKDLAEINFPLELSVDYGFGSPGIFGPDTQMHAFHYRDYQRGFNFHEPQVTQILKHFLDPATAGEEIGVLRSNAFVTALFRASGLGGDIDKFGVDSINETLRVLAEQDNIDLLFQWETFDKELRLIALEIKLVHHITSKQLPKYKKIVHNKVKENVGNMAKLFVLAIDFEGKTARELRKKKNKDWKNVTWWGLLRHFEQVLGEADFKDQDTDFPRLRRALWSLGLN